MLKHANYDIENGLKSLKVGFAAIFNALINKEIEVYQTEFPLSRHIVDLGLELCYNKYTTLNSVTYIKGSYKAIQKLQKDSNGEVLYTMMGDTNTIIIVIFEIDRTIFYRIN